MTRVRIGVVGCGAIAQVQHLPNLLELDREFEVSIVCDIVPQQAEYAARRFHIGQSASELDAVLAADIDAVLLCHADPKTEAAVKAFQAGKHVLVEKPVCLSLEEVDALVEAQIRAGTVGQAAYMKVYDPAFVMAEREVAGMDFKFVQANHLHPSNQLHLDHFNVQHVGRPPAPIAEAQRRALRRQLRQAFGPLFERAEPIWGMTYGLIHDLYSLRKMVGVPSGVKSVDIWKGGRAITAVLEYPEGARCVLSRVDLEKLWDFRQTLEVYSDDKRVLLSYPTGFSRRVPSTLVVQGIDAEGTSYRREPAVPWESAFTAELRHFHACITQAVPCRTPLAQVKHDVQLIIDITKSHITGAPVINGED